MTSTALISWERIVAMPTPATPSLSATTKARSSMMLQMQLMIRR